MFTRDAWYLESLISLQNAFPSKAVQGKLDGYRISIDLFIEEAKVTRIPLPFNVSTIVTTRPITIKSLKKVERHSKFLNFYGGVKATTNKIEFLSVKK